MKKSSVKNKFTLKLITYFWLGLLALSILSIFIVQKLDNAIQQERLTNKDKVEMVSLGYILANRSDFLTAEARNFAVTANPLHMMRYWDEVFVSKTRDYCVSRLKQLSANKNEIALLAKSKRNSDALILTEIRSMKLVLEAHNIPNELTPEPVRNYILPEYEKNLSANNKMLLAQKIMFNEQYYDDKKLIMDPIAIFEKQLNERTNIDLQKNEHEVNKYRIYLITTISLLAIFIFIIIWLRILYLR
ncbi:MAG: hypothetical protein VX335_04285 [Pseudomonadota bacterium]|nr:hypothetical protein [Pseudomonadota bacterium]